MQGE
jgi:hypothetical protein